MDSLKDIKLGENEEVIKVVRHHLIIIIPHLVICFLILVLAFFLIYPLFLQGWWGIVAFFAIIFFVLFYIFRLIFLFRHNTLIITNKRLIDHERVSFFEQYIDEFPYSKIKEAKAIKKGIFPTIFKYGNLRLILDNDIAPFELYKIGQPLLLQDEINRLIKMKDVVPETGNINKPEINRISLVMAEVAMLSHEEQIEIVRRIEILLNGEKIESNLEKKDDQSRG